MYIICHNVSLLCYVWSCVVISLLLYGMLCEINYAYLGAKGNAYTTVTVKQISLQYVQSLLRNTVTVSRN